MSGAAARCPRPAASLAVRGGEPHSAGGAAGQALRPLRRAVRRLAWRSPPASSSVLGPLRLRQNHSLARHRRARAAKRGPYPAGRSGHHLSSPLRAGFRYRLPVLRAVPQSDGGRECRLWAARPCLAEAAADRAGEGTARSGWPCRPDRQISGPTLGRAAAARGVGPRTGPRTWSPAAGRAALGAGCHRSPWAPVGTPGATAPPRHHLHHGHARPGGGDGDRRPHRGDAGGPDRAGRYRSRTSTIDRPRPSLPALSAAPPPSMRWRKASVNPHHRTGMSCPAPPPAGFPCAASRCALLLSSARASPASARTTPKAGPALSRPRRGDRAPRRALAASPSRTAARGWRPRRRPTACALLGLCPGAEVPVLLPPERGLRLFRA